MQQKLIQTFQLPSHNDDDDCDDRRQEDKATKNSECNDSTHVQSSRSYFGRFSHKVGSSIRAQYFVVRCYNVGRELVVIRVTGRW